jgi:ParB family chromosome partitioning protein
LELALVENIQRADLNPLEEAMAFRQLVDEFEMTQEQVADRVGKSRVSVTNTLRLLRLPAAAKQALLDGSIREGHARVLLALPTEEAQLAALKTVMSRGLSVRQTEELVRRLMAEPEPLKEAEPVSPELQSLEDDFRETLGTKVNLYRNRKGQGRLVIHFYGEEELQSLYDVIVGGG